MKRTSVPAHKGNYHAGRTGGIRVIVIHTGETGEGSTAAEGMGNWFADARARASAHKGADTDSICTYLPDTATAWAAPGANADGLQLELAGRAGQTSGQWADDASAAILANGATVVREWCAKHGIPARWLTDAQLRDGRTKGLATHAQVSRVFKRSDHWDPGPNFPAGRFLALVTGKATTPAAKPATASKPKPASKAPAFPLPRGHYFGPKSGPSSSVSGYYSHRADLKRWQAQMRKRGWSLTADGLYGPRTATVARQFQKQAGLARDGLIGPATWAAAWTEPVV